MRRPDERGDARHDRRGAARAVPQDQPAVGGDADEVLARRRDADRDALRRRLEARAALAGRRPATVSTPGIVAGAPTRVVPLPRLPAATTTTTSWSNAYRNASSQLSSQSRVLRGQRQVDDVGAVVDRPADRLGDLLGRTGFSAPVSCRSRPRPRAARPRARRRSSPLPWPVPRAGGERGHPAAVVRVDRADRRAPVGGAEARDIRAARRRRPSNSAASPFDRRCRSIAMRRPRRASCSTRS